ncbi:MAG: PASTA domain-containing protein [Chitinophagales bacterium]|nr:PASTA domain-containing protein [Chitinophagales bacterium]
MKKIGYQILAIIAITIVLIISLNTFMKFITNHDQKLPLPNVIGLNLEDAIQLLEKNKMGYILVDSLFDPNLKPHEIIDQSPKKGSFVKQNRKVYLTINSMQPPIIQLPNLVDMSKRQAQLTLESLGLKMGREIYQPDIAKDAVLSVRVNGKTATENMSIPKGTAVDLILGDGLGTMATEIPDLIGLTVMEAMAVLDAVQLTVGQINAQEGVTDQMSAYVYFQQPEYGSSVTVSPGDPVNLFVTNSIPKNIIK